jgi:MraZ protein
MTTFLASYVNGVDRKGRVSVPASFRAELASHSRQTVVVYAAPQVAVSSDGRVPDNNPKNNNKGMYLYAWAYDDFVKLAERIAQLPALSPTRQRLARTILAAARPLNFDETGRIQLPENMMHMARITDTVLFAGEGEYFTIWEPAAFDAQLGADQAFAEQDLADLSEVWKKNDLDMAVHMGVREMKARGGV